MKYIFQSSDWQIKLFHQYLQKCANIRICEFCRYFRKLHIFADFLKNFGCGKPLVFILIHNTIVNRPYVMPFLSQQYQWNYLLLDQPHTNYLFMFTINPPDVRQTHIKKYLKNAFSLHYITKILPHRTSPDQVGSKTW